MPVTEFSVLIFYVKVEFLTEKFFKDLLKPFVAVGEVDNTFTLSFPKSFLCQLLF